MSATILDWGMASQQFPGETESGDRCVVQVFDTGALAVVIDALGHGPEAAHAADVATRLLEQNAREKPGAGYARRGDERGRTRLVSSKHDLAGDR